MILGKDDGRLIAPSRLDKIKILIDQAKKGVRIGIVSELDFTLCDVDLTGEPTVDFALVCHFIFNVVF